MRQLIRGRTLSFHADPADTENAFTYHPDGAIITRNGTIEAIGDYAALRDPALREMDMGVDEAGQDQVRAVVDFGQAQAAQGGVIAYGLDPAVMGDDGAVLVIGIGVFGFHGVGVEGERAPPDQLSHGYLFNKETVWVRRPMISAAVKAAMTSGRLSWL